MNGRVRIAWCGAAATVLTSLCLFPLVSPSGWLVEAAFFVFLLAGVGLLARRLALPRPVTVLVQVLLAVLLLTLAFVAGAAWLGFLPSPAALRQLGELYAQGGGDTSHYTTPAPDTPGLRLLLVSAVVAIGLLVDALAATYQRVALAGLPLLGLYAVGTGMHPRGPLWLWFLLAGFGYLALLLTEGQDRLSRWGKVFTGTAASMAGTPGNPVSSAGYRIAGLAVAAALVLPVALPGANGGLVPGLGHGGSGSGGNGVITSVDPMASLARALQQPREQPVLTYRSTAVDLGDQYLRIVDLDVFNGVAWTAGTHSVSDLHKNLPSVGELNPAVAQTAVTTEITTEPSYQQQWLPMPYPAISVSVDTSHWKYVPEGRTIIGKDEDQTSAGLDYTVGSLALHPTADELRQAGGVPADIRKNYLSLPKDLPAVVSRLARTVTQDAQTPYDQAVALQDWFTHNGGFSYSTSVPAGTGINAMAEFIQRRTGFCVHFASTMAAMARSLGIPARVAVGFTPGTQLSDGRWQVTTKDAHAWPELYFAGLGWLRFEPTPTRGVTPAYTAPQATASTGPQASAAPSESAQAGPRASAAAGCDAERRRIGDCGLQPQSTGHAARTGTGWPSATVVAACVLGGLLVLALLFPMLWRLRLRRARLRRRPELTDQQVLAAWQELIDSAWDLGIAPDDAETPRRAAARLAVVGALSPEAKEAVGRLALATEQVLYAPEVQAPVSPRTDLRTARAGLTSSVDRRTRWRAVLLPASTTRLLNWHNWRRPSR